MRLAKYYKKVKDKVQCELCPRNCMINDERRGNCGVRINRKGKLYSLVYGKAVSSRADPIEKKPLYHFLPGTNAFSIGTAGCNLHCLFCQNWEISQVKPEDVPSKKLMPNDVVDKAVEEKCKSIAYTYSEPTIAIEYCMDTAKVSGNLKNVIVSNGFINETPLKDLCKVIDGANIDLKAFNEEFYKKIGGSLKPVLNALKILKRHVWLEITYLVVPGMNDNISEVKGMCEWIRDNLGREVPLHFSRFFPMYKMLDKPATDEKTLLNLHEVAKKYLNYVYVGNLRTKRGENTYCPKCGVVLIARDGFRIVQNNITNGKCKCGAEIPGVWE